MVNSCCPDDIFFQAKDFSVFKLGDVSWNKLPVQSKETERTFRDMYNSEELAFTHKKGLDKKRIKEVEWYVFRMVVLRIFSTEHNL